MFHLRPLFVEHFVCCTKYLMSSSALSAVLGGGGGEFISSQPWTNCVGKCQTHEIIIVISTE